MSINRPLQALAGASFILALSLSISTQSEGKDQGTPADSAPFTQIIAFGDSLTDTGNFFSLTGYPPEPFYSGGRFSDGPVWIEYLAAEMGLAPGALSNYAFAGATTGRANVSDVPGIVDFAGLLDEIDLFEGDLGGKRADRRALWMPSPCLSRQPSCSSRSASAPCSSAGACAERAPANRGRYAGGSERVEA